MSRARRRAAAGTASGIFAMLSALLALVTVAVAFVSTQPAFASASPAGEDSRGDRSSRLR